MARQGVGCGLVGSARTLGPAVSRNSRPRIVIIEVKEKIENLKFWFPQRTVREIDGGRRKGVILRVSTNCSRWEKPVNF